ncbi:hypothetical protein BU110_00610 [Staphylococcus shinii]|uniref:DUF4870 domain-containing protein n=1 Tax=Staphylococcus TaxID=1279 RepID=UPI000D1ED0DD|nr:MULTISPECIES: DUF4870 domain-containing protein [Staphylococcus]PTI68089.1 hypothetical protein BU110_00610 [Staphylococcus shinii]RIM80089.1 DUF4870 domain-containing protein [Staphylococcus xylosus]
MSNQSTQSEKILAALSYFSVFFAPILFPIIVWILANKPVSTHAKKSLAYHILPYILIFVGVGLIGLSESNSNNALGITLIVIAVIAFIGAIYYVIYNLYCGIKVLLKDNLY